MKKETVYVVSRNGLVQAPEDLQRILAVNFFGLSVDSELSPATILFYADGVKLACEGSAVVESLRALEKKGTRLILCRTCLDYFGLMDKVAVGSVGKMTDIVAALEAATKVVSV
jgi:sulfur relay (sulfurtransferase) complex TusBCD TusD component (DsrE family)